MKKYILLLLFFSLIATSLNSAPNFINFQAVVRDGEGKLLSNKIVMLRLSLLSNSSSGSILYRERHSILTNQNGIATLQIGSGVGDMGIYNEID